MVPEVKLVHKEQQVSVVFRVIQVIEEKMELEVILV